MMAVFFSLRADGKWATSFLGLFDLSDLSGAPFYDRWGVTCLFRDQFNGWCGLLPVGLSSSDLSLFKTAKKKTPSPTGVFLAKFRSRAGVSGREAK